MPFASLGADLGGGDSGTTRTVLELSVPAGTYALAWQLSVNSDGGFANLEVRVVDATDDILFGGTNVLVNTSTITSSPQVSTFRGGTPVEIAAPATFEIRATWSANSDFGTPADDFSYSAVGSAGEVGGTFLQLVPDGGDSSLILASVRQVYVNPWTAP